MYIESRDYFLNRILHTDARSLAVLLENLDQCYHTFQIPKRGGLRTIRAVSRETELYRLQRALCRNFLDKIPLPIPAVGFVREESYLTFLKPHVGKNFYLRLDIQHFFDSITTAVAAQSFQEFFSRNTPENLEDFLMLCTYHGRLPQGAASSPAVSNVVFRQADQRILKYCQSFDTLYRGGQKLSEDICYTRYADDLLFSSRYFDFTSAPYFTGMICKILQSSGFRLNREKVKTGRREISLSGFVVSQNIHLSRKKLYMLNKLLYFLGKTEVCGSKKYRVRKSFFQEPGWLEQINRLELERGHGVPMRFLTPQEFVDYLCGYRAFLLSVRKANDVPDSATRQLDKKVKKLEAVIDCALAFV